jgi:hypothetical protein
MREIRTSGLMSGEGKRVAHAAPRPSSTLPLNPAYFLLTTKQHRLAPDLRHALPQPRGSEQIGATRSSLLERPQGQQESVPVPIHYA